MTLSILIWLPLAISLAGSFIPRRAVGRGLHIAGNLPGRDALLFHRRRDHPGHIGNLQDHRPDLLDRLDRFLGGRKVLGAKV